MKRSTSHRAASGFTLIELLCVMAIIAVLASLLLGPALRILQRVRADKWQEDASALIESSVTQLNRHFRGRRDFPRVTLEWIETEGLLRPSELRFLRDSRVTFTPFAGSDPDEKIVIYVELKRGFWNDAGCLTESKEAITRLPQ